MKIWFTLVVNLFIVILCTTVVARADESAKTKARQHFKQGVELFDQRRFGDALTEFEQSYALFPVYSTLYNVGQVHVALGHPVQAIDAYEKFLVQGGSSVSTEQRERVETELKTQRERVGDIKLDVLPDGAEIRVDGDPIGKAPLKTPVKVATGHHRVEALLEGYHTEQSEIDVRGQGHVEVMLKLQALAPVAPPVAPAEPKPVPTTTNINIAPASAPAAIAPSGNTQTRNERASQSSSSGGVQRAFGYLIASAGLIGGGVGVALAVDGQSKHDDALKQYADGNKAAATQAESNSSNEKTKGYVVIGGSGAVMLTGAILLITAPSAQSGNARINVAPWIGSSATGASIQGTW